MCNRPGQAGQTVPMVTLNVSSTPGDVPAQLASGGDGERGNFHNVPTVCRNALHQSLSEFACLKSVGMMQERQRCFVNVLKERKQPQGVWPTNL